MSSYDLTIPDEWYEIYLPRFAGTVVEFERMMIRVLRKRLGKGRVRWNGRAKRLNRRAELIGASGRVSGAELKSIVDYYKSACAYCHIDLDFTIPSNGRDKHSPTFDHVKPLGRGGSGSKFNLVPACLYCNKKRSTWPDSALGVPAPERV